MDYNMLIQSAINAINLTASIVSLSSALKDNSTYTNSTKGEKSTLGKKFKLFVSEHKETNIEIVIRGNRIYYKKLNKQ